MLSDPKQQQKKGRGEIVGKKIEENAKSSFLSQ